MCFEGRHLQLLIVSFPERDSEQITGKRFGIGAEPLRQLRYTALSGLLGLRVLRADHRSVERKLPVFVDAEILIQRGRAHPAGRPPVHAQ